MLKQLFMVLSIAIVAMLVLAACGDDDDSAGIGSGSDTSTTTTSSTMTTGTMASGDEGEVTAVKMTEMKFDKDAITVTAGEEVTINLENAGSIEHNFTVDEADVDYSVASGESDEFTFTAPSEAGEYEIYCKVPGHREAGMVAKLIVE